MPTSSSPGRRAVGVVIDNARQGENLARRLHAAERDVYVVGTDQRLLRRLVSDNIASWLSSIQELGEALGPQPMVWVVGDLRATMQVADYLGTHRVADLVIVIDSDSLGVDGIGALHGNAAVLRGLSGCACAAVQWLNGGRTFRIDGDDVAIERVMPIAASLLIR